jgi:hypothetical protein
MLPEISSESHLTSRNEARLLAHHPVATSTSTPTIPPTLLLVPVHPSLKVYARQRLIHVQRANRALPQATRAPRSTQRAKPSNLIANFPHSLTITLNWTHQTDTAPLSDPTTISTHTTHSLAGCAQPPTLAHLPITHPIAPISPR